MVKDERFRSAIGLKIVTSGTLDLQSDLTTELKNCLLSQPVLYSHNLS